MAEYAYKVRDMGGRVLSGTMEAENERIVVEELRNRDYFIVEIAEKNGAEF
ncbi:MAG: hypothetical protein ACOX2Q_05885 [Dehalobacterium sp.]